MLPAFCGIVLKHGSYFLLLERTGNAKHWPYYWGFPGGKQETYETTLEAAIRETREEIGIHVNSESIISSIKIESEYIDGKRLNYLFLSEDWEGIPDNLEPKNHRECKWFRKDELPSPIVPHIQAGLIALLDGKDEIKYKGY